MAKKKTATKAPTQAEATKAVADAVAAFDAAVETFGDVATGHTAAKLVIHAKDGRLNAIRRELKKLGHG